MFAKTWETLKRINRFDPVTAFSRLFWGNPLLTAFVVAVVLVSVWWFMGEYSKEVYSSLSNDEICANFPLIKDCPDVALDVIHHTDIEELSFALFLWGVFTPLAWWYYLSTPRIWNDLLASMRDENVIDIGIMKKSLKPVLESSFWMPALLISIFVMVLYILNSLPSEIASGRASFWTLSTQGLITVTAFVGINCFVLISFALKTLILIGKTSSFFANHKIKRIHVIHPDQCGGFGAIGKLATRISTLAVFIGLWAVWYSMLPVFSSQKEMNLGFTVILLYIAYIVLVPVFLITLTKPAGDAMKLHKQQMLLDISKKIQKELESSLVSNKPEDAKKQDESRVSKYENLLELYDRLSKMPESPIKLLNLKRFTSFAVFPALFGSMSFTLNIVEIVSGINIYLSKLR